MRLGAAPVSAQAHQQQIPRGQPSQSRRLHVEVGFQMRPGQDSLILPAPPVVIGETGRNLDLSVILAAVIAGRVFLPGDQQATVGKTGHRPHVIARTGVVYSSDDGVLEARHDLDRHTRTVERSGVSS